MSPPEKRPNAKLEELQHLIQEAATLTVDQIRERFRPIFAGMIVSSPIIDEGFFLYRARKIDDQFNMSTPMRLADLVYPRPETVGLNRANRAGRPMFYCSTGKEPLFFEIGELKAGDELVLTSWQTMSRSRRIKRGEFPAPIRIGSRNVAWLKSEVDAWELSRIAKRNQALGQVVRAA